MPSTVDGASQSDTATTVSGSRAANFAATLLILGALFVFQGESSLAKTGYTALVFLYALHLLVVRRGRDLSEGATDDKFPTFLAICCLVIVASQMATAVLGGTAVQLVIRDSLPYLLLIALPAIGVRIGPAMSGRYLLFLLFALTPICSIAFASDWIARRGLSESGGRFLLSSSTLVVLLFCFAATSSVHGRRRLMWALVAGVSVVSVLLSGTRTFLVLFAAAAIFMTGRLAKGRIPPVRLAAATVAGGMLFYISIPVLENAYLEPGYIASRFNLSALRSDDGLSQDQSFEARTASYSLARQQWREDRLFGTGFGYQYEIPTRDRGVVQTTSLDTPWLLPAKIGAVGTSFYLLFIVAFLRFSLKKLRLLPEVRVALIGWIGALVAYTPFSAWPEDKGTSVALLLIGLMIGAAASMRRERSRSQAE